MRKNTVVPDKWEQITANTVSLTRQKKNHFHNQGCILEGETMPISSTVSGAVEQLDFLRLFPPSSICQTGVFEVTWEELSPVTSSHYSLHVPL